MRDWKRGLGVIHHKQLLSLRESALIPFVHLSSIIQISKEKPKKSSEPIWFNYRREERMKQSLCFISYWDSSSKGNKMLTFKLKSPTSNELWRKIVINRLTRRNFKFTLFWYNLRIKQDSRPILSMGEFP